MKTNTTEKIAISSILMTLVVIGTMLIQIPIPKGSGYIHLGDSIVMIAGVLLGGIPGGIAAGLGSAMADILSGWGIYAMPTFFTKFLMAFIVGKMFNPKKIISIKNIVSILLAIATLAFGYYIWEAFIMTNHAIALAGIPANLIQGVAGSIIFVLLIGKIYPKLKK